MRFAQEILFPIDFSPSSMALGPAVAAVAQRLQANVTLLTSLPLLDSCDEMAAAQQRAVEKLTSFSTDAFGGLPIRLKIANGPAAAAIVEQAALMSAPMIMMPTRGESGFRSLLLGSVTAVVLHDAECPVWTSAHCEDGGPLPVEYKSVICAIDLGANTSSVLRRAAAFAAEFGAELHVVHSVPGINPMFESATANRAHRFLVTTAQDAYREIVGLATDLELPPLEIAEEVGLAEGIVAATTRHRAELLVIGRGVMQGVLGRLRTNAHELIRKSACPVLSV